MNAMIFAAGLGTRLFPLTQNCPKAMVPVNGKPLLWYAINNVIKAGACRIVVNAHHFAGQIVEYIGSKPFGGEVEILISDEQDELLETGGGLLKATPLFVAGQPILIHNADVLTNVDLNELVRFHQKKGGLASLMVESRKTSRYFLFDEEERLVGWENQTTSDQIILDGNLKFNNLAFDGVHVVEYDILKMLGTVRRFSITNGYLDLMKNAGIYGWSNWSGQWFDVGTPEKHSFASNNFKFPAV